MGKEGTEEVVLETPEEPIPTVESVQAELQQALDKATQAEDKATKLESSYKGLQNTVNEKDRKLKEQIDLQTRLDNFEDKLKILAVAQSMGRPEESLEGMSDKEKQDLLSKFDDIDKRYKETVKETEGKRQQTEYQEKADVIWNRAEKLGLTDEDDDYWFIWDALAKDGNLRKAEVTVSKLEQIKQVKPLANQETEEELEARLEKKFMEKHGLLITDPAIPSGRSKSSDDIRERYINGDRSMSAEELAKAGIG